MMDAAGIVSLIHAISRRVDADVMLVGGADERQKAQEVESACRGSARVHELLTPNSIPEFVAMLTQADALICGDTLALHIAAAIGLPAVALFGPTSIAEIDDFGGLIDKVWSSDMDCLGCYGDCSKQSHCMNTIDPESIATRISERLRTCVAF
jgi:ADP-heptose:LPS heptosyltransferase